MLPGGVAALLTLLLRSGPLPEGFSDVRCVALGPAAGKSAREIAVHWLLQ